MATAGFRRFVVPPLLTLCVVFGAGGQTRKPLTNNDIVNMTKEGFDADVIAKAIQLSSTDFDVSAQALVDLKNAGVNSSVLSAMLAAQAAKPLAIAEAAHGAISASGGLPKSGCNSRVGCLLRESTEIGLMFAADLSSKTSNFGDSVELSLVDDLNVGDTVVVPRGSHAVATVSSVKRSGMLGRPGELSVQLQYLVAGDNHVRIRGTKGRQGQGETGATVMLTVMFGPIGLIKHGKNVNIPAGTRLMAYVDQDIWLRPAR